MNRERNARILEMLGRGLSYGQVANRLRISRCAVAGVAHRAPNTFELSAAVSVRRLLALGLTPGEITAIARDLAAQPPQQVERQAGTEASHVGEHR